MTSDTGKAPDKWAELRRQLATPRRGLTLDDLSVYESLAALFAERDELLSSMVLIKQDCIICGNVEGDVPSMMERVDFIERRADEAIRNARGDEG